MPSTKKIKRNRFKVGDVVKTVFAADHEYAAWDGIVFKITSINPCGRAVRGEIQKIPYNWAFGYRKGAPITWDEPDALVLYKDEDGKAPEKPSPNAQYLDHIHDRVLATADPSEILEFVERLRESALKNL